MPRTLLCKHVNTYDGSLAVDSFLQNIAGNTFPGCIVFSVVAATVMNLTEEHKRLLDTPAKRASTDSDSFDADLLLK